MNKLERVDNVLNGLEVDRPPVSLWYHFGIQHGSGEQFAKITLKYFNYYDFDFLKVMNDYFYPFPKGLDTLQTREDLKTFTRFDVQQSIWQEQLKAIEIIHKELDGKAYFMDTVFDPWQSIKRHMAGDNIKSLMENEPEALKDALEVITENLIEYSKQCLNRGAAGIFMSVPAAAELLTRDEFFTFDKPYSIKVFEAVSGLGNMNTAHIHGNDLYFDDCLDFPVNVFSWWDRGPNGPSMEDVKQKTKACVMGGIDHTLVAKTSPAFLKKHVREGIALGGENRFFLANGCAIDTWTYPGSIEAIVATANAAGDR